MGQQQLLLVILVTIIVGIATVVAINTFGSAADSANLDAVRQDLASIAAAAQGDYMKPDMLGGGSRSFDDFSFEGLGVPGDVSGNGSTLTNENGTYTFEDDDQTLTVTAEPASQASDPDIEDIVAIIRPDGMEYES